MGVVGGGDAEVRPSLRQPPAPAHAGLLAGAPEEVVLQRVVRRYPRLGVVLQHPQDQVLEPQVVRHAVAGLAQPPPARPARLHAEDVVDLAGARAAVLLLLAHVEHVGTVGQLVEVSLGLGRLVQHVLGREAEHLHDLVDLVHLVLAGEQRLPRVHLHEDAAEAPHVDGEVVRDPEEDLGAAVEPALNVLIDALAELARGTEVDNLDRTSLGVAEENILWLQITMDNFQLGRGEEEERSGDLLCKFSSEVERHAPEVGVAQQVVQVVGEELEHQTQVVAPHEVVLQLDYVVLVLLVRAVHHLQQFVFYLSLLQERLLVLDDLDRDVTAFNLVLSLDYLTEGTFTNKSIYFIPVTKNCAY